MALMAAMFGPHPPSDAILAFGIGCAPKAVCLSLGVPPSRGELERVLSILAVLW